MKAASVIAFIVLFIGTLAPGYGDLNEGNGDVALYTNSAELLSGDSDLDIAYGRAYPIPTDSNTIYQLQGRDSPFTNAWYGMGDPIAGTGGMEYGFERGDGPIFLPARRWQEKPDTDGYALQFDGVNDFAYVPHNALLNLASALTLEAWVKPASTAAGTLITKASSSSIVCYGLGLNAQNKAVFRIYDASGSTLLSITGSTALVVGEWKHVSAAWDGAQGRVLVDGVLDASGPGAGTARVSTISSFQVGGIFGAESFAGCLDQIRVWNFARAQGEVQSDYHALLNGSEAGLVGLWRFTADEGQSALDSTVNALHLNLGSDPVPDASDPTICTESFPPLSAYTEIFNFGETCLVVGHEAVSGGLYQVEVAENIVAGIWPARGMAIEAKTNWVDHINVGTNANQALRVRGPFPVSPMYPAMPADWVPILNPQNGHYYCVVTGALTWANASNAAMVVFNGVVGHLATITNADENAFIAGIMPENPTAIFARLGGFDEGSEGTWRWITGEDFTYTNWNSGEPNSGTAENYLVMITGSGVSKGKWNDVTGLLDNATGYFVVEWP